MRAVSKSKGLKAFRRQKLSPPICDFAYLLPMVRLIERIVGSLLTDILPTSRYSKPNQKFGHSLT